MYGSSRGLNHEEQRGEENITYLLIMDPWSKVDYSRIIREASMVKEKLPEVNPPSGRVPRRGLLALSILEARRGRNRGDIAKRVLFSKVSCEGEYIGEGGQPGGP